MVSPGDNVEITAHTTFDSIHDLSLEQRQLAE